MGPRALQVLRRLRAAQIRSYAEPDQALVASDQQLARRYPPFDGLWQQPDDAQQRPVIQSGQVFLKHHPV